MANKDDYLIQYRKFFENFAQTVNPNDQLPVKLASYKLINLEVVGGVIDWTTQYLTQKKCPLNLFAPLIQIIIDEIRKSCKKQPMLCGFNPSDNAYEPLKLMQSVMAKTNEVCLRYLDNSMLCSLPQPDPFANYNLISVCAVKNRRRRMEDRHVVVHDLNIMFNLQEASPSSYYAVFDGHAGHDAAAYSSAHLHQFLAESKYFSINPEQALLDAFYKTDALFVDKCKIESFNSGTTVVCALLRPKDKDLYIAWVGDSQALLVKQGKVLQCVSPHKPNRKDERARIEKQGGHIVYWGTWRINGQLAVSRAIGDADYKPHVSAVPDIVKIALDGGEDFLILACDGLWDYLCEDDAATEVYNLIYLHPDNIEQISERLVQLSKAKGSTDNISVIVIFLREIKEIVADAHWANRNSSSSPINTMDNTSLDNTNNPFANSNGTNQQQQQQQSQQQISDGLLLNLTENFNKQNNDDDNTSTLLSSSTNIDDFFTKNDNKPNGKRLASEFEDDDDDDDENLGPETNIDCVDDCVSFSTKANEFISSNNNANEHFNNPFLLEKNDDVMEKNTFDLQKQATSDVDHDDRLARDETPTPPADTIHDVGLIDNLAADSGEESEDEWNYIKGDEANKENINPTTLQPETEVAEEEEDIDSMSQLNPNAAEFVPVSPTRSIPSPACRSLINDEVLAQSPKRPPIEIEDDINLPNANDFENEVRSRPSDVDNYKNGHHVDEDEDEQKLSSVELMENLLNGKNIDEIPEFQPSNSPNKSTTTTTGVVTPTTTTTVTNDEFHFGPNAAPFTPAKYLDQSLEAGSSTRAVFGDESTTTLGTSFNESFLSNVDNVDFTLSTISKKTDDPMFMSFYQDDNKDVLMEEKEESKLPKEIICDDLNKVHDLPDDLDDFLNNKSTNDNNSGLSFNDTISDLPEHEPFVNNEKCEKNKLTDLDDEKELASPITNEPYNNSNSEMYHLNETAIIETSNDNNNILDESKIIDLLPQTQADIEPVQSSEPVLLSPKPMLSPEPILSTQPSETILSTEPETLVFDQEILAVHSESPVMLTSNEQQSSMLEAINDESKSSIDFPIHSKSPVVVVEEDNNELICTTIDNVVTQKEFQALDPPQIDNFSNLTRSPEFENLNTAPSTESLTQDKSSNDELEQYETNLSSKVEYKKDELSIDSPIEDITSSVKDDDLSSASIKNESPLPVEVHENIFIDNTNLLASLVSQPPLPPLLEQQQEQVVVIGTTNEELQNIYIHSTPKSISDIESVATTTDINSFLDRSLLADIASPLSPNEPPINQSFEGLNLVETLDTKCVSPVVLTTDTKINEPITDSTLIETNLTVSEPIKEAISVVTTSIPIAETVGVVTEKKVSKTSKSPLAKKPAGKTQVSPTKSKSTVPTTVKATTTFTVSRLANVKSTTSTIGSKTTLPTTKPLLKPKTIGITNTTKVSGTKSLTNGDVKLSNITKTTTVRKSLEKPTTKPLTTSSSKLSPLKSSAPKSAVTNKPATLTRPTTASKTTRPTTFSARTTTSSRVPSSSPLTSVTRTTTVTSKTTPKSTLAPIPKARPATAPATTTKPRVPLAKSVSKTTDSIKERKDSANKLTASRLSSTKPSSGTTLSGRTTATTSRNKVESKISSTRTTSTAKTTTTLKSSTITNRKPAAAASTVEVTRNNLSNKTKTTKIEKRVGSTTEQVQNGVTTEQIATTVINNTLVIDEPPQLIKDNSPIDNKLLIEANTTD